MEESSEINNIINFFMKKYDIKENLTQPIKELLYTILPLNIIIKFLNIIFNDENDGSITIIKPQLEQLLKENKTKEDLAWKIKFIHFANTRLKELVNKLNIDVLLNDTELLNKVKSIIY